MMAAPEEILQLIGRSLSALRFISSRSREIFLLFFLETLNFARASSGESEEYFYNKLNGWNPYIEHGKPITPLQCFKAVESAIEHNTSTPWQNYFIPFISGILVTTLAQCCLNGCIASLKEQVKERKVSSLSRCKNLSLACVSTVTCKVLCKKKDLGSRDASNVAIETTSMKQQVSGANQESEKQRSGWSDWYIPDLSFLWSYMKGNASTTTSKEAESGFRFWRSQNPV